MIGIGKGCGGHNPSHPPPSISLGTSIIIGHYSLISVKVGFIINPIAGMGGSVGLKGTDTPEIVREALQRGARPRSGSRAMEAMQAAGPLEGYDLYTAGGLMGEGVLVELGATHFTVVHRPGAEPGPGDTKRTCSAFLSLNVEIILFAGGDGTARDVMDVVGEKVPVIGVPTGVKMQSAVFANDPKSAGILLKRVRVEVLPSKRAEVMDVDEAGIREGRMSASLYGYMLTPDDPDRIQPFKLILGGGTEEENKEAIAEFVASSIKSDELYILGPGSTVEALAEKMRIPKTLLGVDLVAGGKLLVADADEATILNIMRGFAKIKIVVSPIGAQGFIFGRGNQQISSKVIEEVGIRNIIVLATPTKMRKIHELRVDTGDIVLDAKMRGYGKVTVGYGKQMIVPII